MNTIQIIICTSWALAASGLAWYTAHIASQITYITLADGRRQERRFPLIFRMLLPLTPNIAGFVNKPIFDKLRNSAEKRLATAGFRTVISGNELLALQILSPITIGVLWVLFVKLAILSSHNSMLENMEVIIYIAGILLSFIYPQAWLNDQVKKRHRSIQKSLPFVLDLLTLSVEAGMDFMSALQRNLERDSLDPLGEELLTVIREIQLGKTRKEALHNLSVRVDLPDLRSVTNALIQADELGVSIGSILRIQADQIRQRRFERAEKLANEAPTKLLFPLMIFIFPSVFFILMGPIIVQMLKQGF